LTGTADRGTVAGMAHDTLQDALTARIDVYTDAIDRLRDIVTYDPYD
jgi:hypothetical protein